MAAAASQGPWSPYDSLTTPPTNLKEAIDWVLRVTGKDGKSNKDPLKPATPPQFGCLCFFAKAVKDLLYDAKDPGSPGPSPKRYWDDILLPGEQSIVKPVLTDLGLLSAGSTGAASTTCAGGTEVIKALIDQLALGLQKWVGWQEDDKCCLKGDNGVSKGIGRKCECRTGGGICCSPGGSTCNCATAENCYKSAYKRPNGAPGGSSSPADLFLWTSISSDSTKVHLLARIFLGSVCLIWSGLSQLGFLTKEGSGSNNERWSKGELSKETANLGSFMAAMGYDLERLNQGQGNGKTGSEVADMLSKAFNDVKEGANQDSVAEYYSTIYQKAVEAKNSTTESICKEYPLLVLHILASGYFRAGSAGARGVITPKSSTSSTTTTETTKKPRHPRTIREILYWLSALPYSEKYRELVDRMKGKYPPKEDDPKTPADDIKLYNDKSGADASTTLKRDDITHYLMAACGYCPLVLIGIQGTIATSGNDSTTGNSNDNQGGSPNQNNPQSGGNSNGNNQGGSPKDNKCPEHKKNPSSKRCTLEEIKKRKEEAAKAQASQTPSPQQPSATTTGKPLEEGQVCYGGYHLEVSKFGPLHGMYANGLFGFHMDMSSAQCLDQLRVYVYHCFYQLYFLRKQCGVGVVVAGAAKTVLGWNSCRYGSGVAKMDGKLSNKWICEIKDGGVPGVGVPGVGVPGVGVPGVGVPGDEHTKKCGLQDKAQSRSESALQSFLCDTIGGMSCRETVAKDVDKYPEIETHWTTKDNNPPGHLEKPHGHCPVPMGWDKDKHFKDLTQGSHKQESLTQPKGGTSSTTQKYPAHCTGNTLSHLLEYYCDPEKCHGTLVVLLRLLACITPTVPRTLGDLFGFYYYVVYIGGKSGAGGQGMHQKLKSELGDVRLSMLSYGDDAVAKALEGWSSGDCSGKGGNLNCLTDCTKGATGQCCQYLSPLSGQQYGQLSPVMAGTYLSWLVYLIGEFQEGLKGLKGEFQGINCASDGCNTGGQQGTGCGGQSCAKGSHGDTCTGSGSDGVCKCPSVVSCTGVLPVLYKYGFGYGNVKELHKTQGPKKCHDFLETLNEVLGGDHLKKDGSSGGLHHEINQLIYTTRLPWIFVLTLAWLVAVLYLAFGAIWPLDWTHMRSHCRGWFSKGSLSTWEILMVGKKKGRGILEFFGGR